MKEFNQIPHCFEVQKKKSLLYKNQAVASVGEIHCACYHRNHRNRSTEEVSGHM